MTAKPWIVAGGGDCPPASFLVAGILNLTPDSFSDGGSYVERAAALEQARKLALEGAHILDIGAESTRPGSAFISAEEEERRLLPVLREILEQRKDWAEEWGAPLISIDTWRAATAAKALEAGAEIINDISAAAFDPAMPEVLAQYAPGYVLMHTPADPKTMQEAPRYTDVVEEILAFFAERMNILVRAGLPEDRIALDPGIGFGKSVEHNLELLRSAPRLLSLGRPLYYGVSRKAFLGSLLNLPVGARDNPTMLVTLYLALRGVYVHRVHEVAGAAQALRLAEVLRKR